MYQICIEFIYKFKSNRVDITDIYSIIEDVYRFTFYFTYIRLGDVTMTNISEIASKANVSRTLVSRVLNNKTGVSDKKRREILSVIEELNYKPNALARSLVTQKTQTIGIIMDQLCDSYFFDLIQGLQDTGEKLGYNIIFCSGRGNEEIKQKYFDFFLQGRTDGVIAYGSYLKDQKVIDNIVSSNACFVLIEGTFPHTAINNVQVDNYLGAYKATEHLIKVGYKKIRHFSGDMNYKVSLDRFNGFIKAMQDYSIPLSTHDIINADFFEQSGYDQMQKIILSGDIPDAIFFGSDKTAFGAIKAMYENGLKTPEDIAIIGFDDDKPKDDDIKYPKLTTLRQPLYKIGVESINLLVEAINNPEMKPKIKVFEPELIIRETCK